MSAVRDTATRLALLAVAVLAGGCGMDGERDRGPGSTLEATVVDPDGDGDLTGGPAEPLADRTELAARGSARREAARIGQLTDTHVRDEESPLRVPFLDRLGDPVTEAFRPQEALSSQVLNDAIRAMNEERPQAVLVTGDLIDNAQRNELDEFLAVMRGGQVDPDSGASGYDGVQDASNPDGFFYRPDLDAPQLPGLLRRASTAFFAQGLRAPWYPALGNHDLLVQGQQPASARLDEIAAGRRALLTFDPDLAARIERRLPPAPPGAGPDLRGLEPGAIEELLADGVPSERATRVPADAARRTVTERELVGGLARAAGVAPEGGRLDYAVDVADGVRAIVLDTVDRSGGAGGVLLPAQVAFLRRELARAGDRAVLVASHHALDRAEGGQAALDLLDGDRRVIAELAGDRHRNEIRPVRSPAGGRWRITTASLADWPQQGRMLRLVTGDDGSRALETWMVDHAGGLTAADLGGAARQLAYDDAQGGRPRGAAGAPADRNARLWLPPSR